MLSNDEEPTRSSGTCPHSPQNVDEFCEKGAATPLRFVQHDGGNSSTSFLGRPATEESLGGRKRFLAALGMTERAGEIPLEYVGETVG
jgi:hypothetical protein